MNVYVVVHEHPVGATLYTFSTVVAAQKCLAQLKAENVFDLGIDESSSDLDAELDKFGHSFGIAICPLDKECAA